MKKTLLLLTFCGIAISLSAQINKDVEVTRTYDPTVMDAQKIWYEPSAGADSTGVKDAFSYSIFPKTSPGNFGLTPISSAKFTGESDKDASLGYLRAGIGYQISPMLDFYISNKNTETALVGFYANHRSFFGKTRLKNEGFEHKLKSDYMNNDLGLFSKFFLPTSTVTLNADYSRRDLRLYGLDPALFQYYSEDYLGLNDNKRAFNLFNLNGLWKSDADEGEVFYTLGASYQYFNGKNKADGSENMVENAFAVSGNLGAALNDNSQTVSIAARAAYYNRNDNLDALGNNFLLSATPTWAYNDDKAMLKLGLQYVMDNYNSKTKHRLYPAISASYKISDYFVPMIELKGETEVNNFRKIATENPYVGFPVITANSLSPIVFKNTNHKFIGVFSVKGDVDAFSYNAFISYSKIDNLLMYANVPAAGATSVYDYNTFSTVYGDGSKTSIGAELSYKDETFSAYLKGVYNNYSVKVGGVKLDHAWHKPSFEANLTLRYKALDNLILSADMRSLTGRYAYDNSIDAERKLKSVFDLGLGAEVLITEKFSTFVNISNILNQKYDVYSRYQVPGLIFSAGVTFKF